MYVGEPVKILYRNSVFQSRESRSYNCSVRSVGEITLYRLSVETSVSIRRNDAVSYSCHVNSAKRCSLLQLSRVFGETMQFRTAVSLTKAQENSIYSRSAACKPSCNDIH